MARHTQLLWLIGLSLGLTAQSCSADTDRPAPDTAPEIADQPDPVDPVEPIREPIRVDRLVPVPEDPVSARLVELAPEEEPARLPTPSLDPGFLAPLPEGKPDLTEDQRAFMARLEAQREEAASMSPEDFQALYPAPERIDALSYDPSAAAHLDTISTAYDMTEAQHALLNENGFVVLDHTIQRTFERAYLQMYNDDLPVLVTSDSLLYALHRGFTLLLKSYEFSIIAPAMTAMLQNMHEELGLRLGRGQIPEALEEAAADVDLYITVALSLLAKRPIDPVSGRLTRERVTKVLNDIQARQPANMTLFGRRSTVDYSQFEPRGSYVIFGMEAYFQAMMWLGRTELALVTFDDDSTQFWRRGFEGAAIFSLLLDNSEGRSQWETINTVLTTLIGEKDSMDPVEMTAFRNAYGLHDLDAIAEASDEALLGGMLASPFGIQRIMSQIMTVDAHGPPTVLPRAFMLMGQRFTIDSLIFNNTTFDRLVDPQTNEKIRRMLPSELDVQFAMGSNVAAELLSDDIDHFGHQSAMHQVRNLVEAHPQTFWDNSFYNRWLGAIRALNDTQHRADQPEAMRTEAWGHKTLNTQLASWAELRHDTILYAKQAFSGGIGCEYPDAYIEPVPAFYAQMKHIAQLGIEMNEDLRARGIFGEVNGSFADMTHIDGYFTNMARIMATLETIAHKELNGEPLTEEEYTFLRGTIDRDIIGCGDEEFDGWYSSLFFAEFQVGAFEPIVADVHTAPTDAMGNPAGWILHAATGFTRTMVFTVNDCEGSRAYVGPVSSYHSLLTENFTRLTDEDWTQDLGADTTSPAWTDSFKR